jgi:hypothetical protein
MGSRDQLPDNWPFTGKILRIAPPGVKLRQLLRSNQRPMAANSLRRRAGKHFVFQGRRRLVAANHAKRPFVAACLSKTVAIFIFERANGARTGAVQLGYRAEFMRCAANQFDMATKEPPSILKAESGSGVVPGEELSRHFVGELVRAAIRSLIAMRLTGQSSRKFDPSP